MITFTNKTMMVLLLCLIFIGQSTASMTMFYTMSKLYTMSNMNNMEPITEQSSKENMNSTSTMTHCQHGNMSDGKAKYEASNANLSVNLNKVPAKDCCAQECDCLTAGCATAAAFLISMNITPTLNTPVKIISFKNAIPNNTISSLYRPPILT